MNNGRRHNISSGAPWETLVSFSRAVRVGPYIHVAGTAAVGPSGEVIAPGDAYGQTIEILKKIESALHQAGAQLSNVVRTRMFVTDISRWEEVARAHSEFFQDILPAATMVEVSRLMTPEMLIEIEADAIVEEG